MSFDILTLKKKIEAMYPYFGGIISKIEYVEDESIDKIERKDNFIKYNPSYLSKLTENDRLFAFAHEICHIAFGHDERGKGKRTVIWDTAADAVINQMLKRDGLEIIEGWIDYSEALDHDVEQYYEILLKEKLDIELIDGNIQGNDDRNNDAECGECSESKDAELEDTDDEECDEFEDTDDDDDEEELVLVEKIEPEAGNDDAEHEREVQSEAEAQPLMDWRYLLLNSINYDVDWSYADAVIEGGLVRPILNERPIPETEIVLDTSWSVDEELLKRFLRECRGILKISKLKIGCFDTDFYGFHDMKSESDLEKMKFEGGGGTDFNVAVNAFSRRVDNRIIFTDGQAEIPDTYLDAIWIVYGEECIKPPGGKVIRIKPGMLKTN